MWVGLFAPKGTPAAAVATLSAALDKAAGSEQFKSVLTNLGLEYAYLNAKDFAAFWDADAKRANEAVKLIGRVG